MGVSFSEFIGHLGSNPAFFITVVLTLAVILLNGWIDAPNAIATCVSTRTLKPRTAIFMAAIFNFLGVLVMTMVNASVAYTIYSMVDFGDNAHEALEALCAAMIAIVSWALFTWKFGIPTSESHALIAGLTGAAIAIQGGFSGINGAEWIKVLYGLALSVGLGFSLGWLSSKITTGICKNKDRHKTTKFFHYGQIGGAASMAFMHGAQDGQKFIGIFLLGIFLAEGQTGVTSFAVPVWLMVLCSVVMAIGMAVGGYRIMKTVGMNMVRLKGHQSFSADIAATVCLLASSLTGLPVSTTHTKSTAVMGVGAARRLSSVNWSVVKNMVRAWILTFPGCGIIGYLIALLFMHLF